MGIQLKKASLLSTIVLCFLQKSLREREHAKALKAPPYVNIDYIDVILLNYGNIYVFLILIIFVV